MNSTHNGFLIHARDYKETSSIINIFTSELGIRVTYYLKENILAKRDLDSQF